MYFTRASKLRECIYISQGPLNNIDNPSPENIVVFKLPTIEISYFVSVLEHKN